MSLQKTRMIKFTVFTLTNCLSGDVNIGGELDPGGDRRDDPWGRHGRRRQGLLRGVRHHDEPQGCRMNSLFYAESLRFGSWRVFYASEIGRRKKEAVDIQLPSEATPGLDSSTPIPKHIHTNICLSKLFQFSLRPCKNVLHLMSQTPLDVKHCFSISTACYFSYWRKFPLGKDSGSQPGCRGVVLGVPPRITF